MKNYFIFFIFLFIFIPTNSQNETNNWYFGFKGALKIDNKTATSLTNSTMVTSKGSASISNKFGELQFYTNSENIYSKNHTPIKNGIRVLGDRNVAQNSIIVPFLNDVNRYYLFTASSSLYFSEINMSNNGGLGEVVSKDNLLIPSGVKGITGVHHKDGKSIWILVSSSSELGNKNTSFYAYLIKPDGTIEPPIITKDIFYERKGDGVLKISPNGKKLAAVNLNNDTSNHLTLFDFDNNTGLVSNRRGMITTVKFFQVVRFYGLEFSNDSNFLYTTVIEEELFGGDINSNPESYIYQYDLNNGNLLNQLTVFKDDDVFEPSTLQLSRNGKIYRAMQKKGERNFNKIGQIKKPTNLENPNFTIDVDLSGNKSNLGLPNFVQSYFRTRILEESACAKNPLTFNIDTYTNIESASWNFGDGETSTEIMPTHTFLNEGLYTVKATIVINGANVEIEKEIEVFPLPKLINNEKIIQCNNGTTDNRFNLNNIKEKINTDTSNLTFYYYETLDNAKNDVSRIPNPENYQNKSNPQTLFTRVINLNSCYDFAEFSIELTSVNLGAVTEMYSCGTFNSVNSKTEGTFNLGEKRIEIYKNFSLNSTNTITFYETENDAQTKRNIIADTFISHAKTIWVRVDSELGCGGIESFNLIVNSEPIINLQENYSICYNPSLKPAITISADVTNNRFEWKDSLGAILSTNKEYTLTSTGAFSLTVYKIENGIECSNLKKFNVTNPDKPIFSSIKVNTEDETNNIIEVEVFGNSTYEFSLDNINFFSNATSHTFINVIPGLKTIYVRDINNCESPIQTKVSVLGIQGFFTPNNDGKNDYWNIKGLDARFYKSINIKIFDRLGRVVGTITDFNTLGWDGTFGGKMQISNSYWFNVQIIDIDDNVIKKTGNFSLIRK